MERKTDSTVLIDYTPVSQFIKEGKGHKDLIVRRGCHEFWTFLMFFEILPGSYDEKLEFMYPRPASEFSGWQEGGQVANGYTVWYQPTIHRYNPNYFLSEHGEKLNFLLKPDNFYCKPDFFLMKGKHRILKQEPIKSYPLDIPAEEEPYPEKDEWNEFVKVKNDISWLVECKYSIQLKRISHFSSITP